MSKLTLEEQQFILDFYFRCGDQNDVEAGRDLIASNPEAAKLYADLESSLTDLDHMKYEVCPDNLVDLTIARLKLVSSASSVSQPRLHQLLAQEQNSYYPPREKPTYRPQLSVSPRKSNFLRPLFEILATAASLALVAGILFPSLGLARNKYQQVACQNNMRLLGAGFSSFADDYNGNFPEAKVKAGDPWWKIGDQGQESQSNTRYPFMLVKLDYVDGKAFICKGNTNAQPVNNGPSVAQMYDFPSRNHVSYSFTLFCDKNVDPFKRRRKIIASDLNPVFEKIPCQQSIYQEMNEFEKVLLNEQLKQTMSANHRGRGQNILYCDGSVEFVKKRVIDGDDIFTVHGVDTYTGREIPTGANDTFLAP
jgi:prepilin-type processing-associated H-X9-DG protein